MAANPFIQVSNPVYTHTFDVPIKSGEYEIGELPIRTPTGRDLLDIGSPVTFDPYTGKPDLDYAVSYAMVSRLSNVPVSILDKGDPAEMIDLFWLVSSFFTKGQQMLLPALEKQRVALFEQAARPEPSSENIIQEPIS